MLHTYISEDKTRDHIPILIIGQNVSDIEKALQVTNDEGNTGIFIAPTKSSPIRIYLAIGKTDEDIVTFLEPIFAHNGNEIIIKPAKEDV